MICVNEGRAKGCKFCKIIFSDHTRYYAEDEKSGIYATSIISSKQALYNLRKK